MDFLSALFGDAETQGVAEGLFGNVFGKKKKAQGGETPLPGPYFDDEGNVMPDDGSTTVTASTVPKEKASFRDVLGYLGDALGRGWNNEPLYENRQKQKKMGEIMEFYDEDPMDAIKQIAKIDINMAQKMLDDYNTAQNREANTSALGAVRDATVQDKALERLGAISASIKDEAGYKRALPMLRRAAEAAGVDFEIGDIYDAGLVAQLAGMIDPYKALRGEQLGRDTDSRIVAREANTRQGAARVATGQRNAATAERGVEVREKAEARQEKWGPPPNRGGNSIPRPKSREPAATVAPAKPATTAKPTSKQTTASGRDKVLPDGRIAKWTGKYNGDPRDSRNYEIQAKK